MGKTINHCAICHTEISEGADVCSPRCAVKYWDHHFPGRRTRRAAAKLARQVGFRSMAEVRFALELMAKRSLKVEYEPEALIYTPPVKQHKYWPDWKITRKDGSYFYIEYKGRLDLQTRKKMLAVKHAYPDLDLRFVFEKPYNKIRKGSPTRYCDWALKHGFKWANNCLPKGWLKK